jgi:phage-related protein
MDIIRLKDSRDLGFIGDSLERIRTFPKVVSKRVGYALRYAQRGEMHPHAKPFKGLGSGNFEIVEDFSGDTYRAVYTVRFESAVYVLHAFQKKSKKGIKTPKKEIDLIKERYRIAKERDDETKK